MNTIEIIISILLNLLPIIILIIPLFFIWKKAIGKLYFRVFAGIIIFFLIYWVFPIIFQVSKTPDNLTVPPAERGNIPYGLAYLTAHFGSLITLFFSYPMITLPFIFFLAPFISILILWNKLRKEDDSVKTNLEQLSYEIKESPVESIKKELVRNNWSREKEIFKLMIVLLPISLYLLQVLFEITNLPTESITTGENALGWFLEILFVYLATFIFSIELLFSSQIALKGRYFGEKIREQTYKSLYTVGAPISILSILLFIVRNINSIDLLFTIFYFFAYFIMASFIFILFLDIFEPISIFIFYKIIDWWKNRGKRKINSSNFYYMLIFGLLGILAYLLLNIVFKNVIYSPFIVTPFSAEETAIFNAGKFISENPNFYTTMQFDVIIIYGILSTPVLLVIILTLFASYGLKYVGNIGLGLVTFLPFIVILSILIGNPSDYWLTGKTSITQIFGFNFFTLRTASIEATRSGLLWGLAAPYIYTRYIFNVIIWSLLIFYFKKSFRSTTIPLGEKTLNKIIFSNITDFLSYDTYIKNGPTFLISKERNVTIKDFEQERDEIKNIMKTLDEDKMLGDLMPKDETENKRFYFTIRYLYTNNLINIWKPELNFLFERVEKQGLYIIYDDGRGVFNYAFRSDNIQDPGLVSGMFSAITSFIKEMTKSAEALKKIDHGDITILIEYGNKIFGALFIKGVQSSEIRAPLKEFVQKFEERYKDILKDWSGALSHFKDEDNNKLVEEIFKED